MKKRVAVIGAGPGGLSAALILAARGFDVTVFERGKRVGGRNGNFTVGDYTFDIGPTFLMMKHLLDEIFEAAGEDSAEWIDFIELDPMYRLQFCDGFSYEPSRDLDKVKAQIAKRFPGAETGVDRFMQVEKDRFDRIAPCLQKPYLHFRDLINPRTLKILPDAMCGRSVFDVLKGYFGQDQLAIAFSFQSKYLGMSPWECPGFFAMLAYIEYAFGVFHVKGGLSEISTGMARASEKHGATIRLQTDVREIVFSGRRATGVSLDTGFEEFDDVVVNADFGWAVQNLFPKGIIKKYSPQRLSSMGISCSTFMLYLGLDKAWPDLRHHTIFFAEDYEKNVRQIFGNQLPDDFSIYVRNASVTDPTLAPEGHSAIYVLVPMPNCRAPIDWPAAAPGVRESVMNLLETRCGMSGLRQHIVEERIVTPADWRDSYRVYDGATFNLAHSIPQMLYFRPRNRYEETDNVYLTGGGTHPGSGLPTIYESGRISANLILGKYGQQLAPTLS